MDNTQPGAGAQQWQYGNSFSPNHEFNIIYPCFDLLEEGETPFIPRPSRQGERYQPFPIVPNASVQANYPWLADTDITVLLQENSVLLPDQVNWLDHQQTFDLWRDLDVVCGHVGFSELRVATYIPPGVAQKSQEHMRIRVSRVTTFQHFGGESTTLPEASYNLADIELQPEQNNPVKVAIDALIFQKEDQHVRHVLKTLSDAGIDSDVWNNLFWPDPRYAEHDLLKAKVKSVTTKLTLQEFRQLNATLPANEKILGCSICRDDLDEMDASTKFILPPCSQKHAICNDCFKQWCGTKGLHKASCPDCRLVIVGPEMSQPNYFDIDADYDWDDEEFDALENDPRSFADIDSRLAQNDGNLITVHEQALLEFWEEVTSSSCEPNDFVYAPEHQLFQSGFMEALQENSGRTIRRRTLFQALLHGVLGTMYEEYKRQGLDSLHSDTDRQEMEAWPLSMPLRPGYRAFIEKQLNRIIAFTHVRECTQHGRNGSKDMLHMHKHGDRSFWSLNNR